MRTKNKTTLVGLIISLLHFNVSSQKNQEKITNFRLKNLLLDAKRNNEYYKKLYKDIDVSKITNKNLSTLPFTTKPMLMDNFDDWVNEFNVKYKDIEKMELNKKFFIYESSGTTGRKTIILNNKNETKHEIIIGATRVWFNFTNIIKNMFTGFRFVSVFPAKDQSCASQNLLNIMSKSIIFKNKITCLDIDDDIDEIIKKINDIQPTIFSSYSNTIDVLIDAAENKKLQINPKSIIAMGETLQIKTVEKIKKIYPNCKIFAMYATTETGQIAYLCPEGHYHINEDWIIVEPVDKNNNILNDNIWSDKIFVTNLWKYKQPIIRYEINDSCKIHHTNCACGKRGTWLEIRGRNDDIIKLKNKNNKQVNIFPLLLSDYIMSNVDKNISKYQFVFNKNKIEIRLEDNKDKTKEETFYLIKPHLEKYLKDKQINEFAIYLSDKLPQIEKSGKFKRIKQI